MITLKMFGICCAVFLWLWMAYKSWVAILSENSDMVRLSDVIIFFVFVIPFAPVLFSILCTQDFEICKRPMTKEEKVRKVKEKFGN